MGDLLIIDPAPFLALIEWLSVEWWKHVDFIIVPSVREQRYSSGFNILSTKPTWSSMTYLCLRLSSPCSRNTAFIVWLAAFVQLKIFNFPTFELFFGQAGIEWKKKCAPTTTTLFSSTSNNFIRYFRAVKVFVAIKQESEHCISYFSFICTYMFRRTD